MLPSQGNRSGSAILDGTPPSPQEKIYKKSVPPGSDTDALLGGASVNDIDGQGSGGVLNSSGNKLMLGVQMVTQAVTLIESIMPGFVPEPVKQWAAVALQMAPAAVDQMNRQPDPTALLSAVGNSAATSPTAMGSPAGSPMMGMQAMGMGQPPMGQPPMPGGMGGRMMPPPPEEEEMGPPRRF